MSRPVTPSTELPTSRKQWRFEESDFPSEWSEEYRPGGFHPVYIDDEFDHGRYRIVRKLGYGSFSTVWLAHDKQASKFVALKVMKAEASLRSETERAICAFLREKARGDPLSEHIVALIDTFDHTGPNGVHTCLFFEPMGPSSASMIEELPCNKSLAMTESPRYPKNMAKVILKHALSGIAFLHKNNVVHGDIQPGNMLFQCADLTSTEEDRLRQPEDAISSPVRRTDGKTDLWAPRYIALGQSLAEFVDLERPVNVKLSDLGSAFWSHEPPTSTMTPVALRSPELVFNEPFDQSIDTWALGCLIYEFLTGIPLFSVFLISDHERDDADDDHILSFTDVLGPLPDHLMRKWSRKDRWIGPQGERLFPPERSIPGGEDDEMDDLERGLESPSADNMEDDGDENFSDEAAPADQRSGDSEHTPAASPTAPSQDAAPEGPFIDEPLEVLFNKNKPDDIDAEEAQVIASLIRHILQYDPALRPTAEGLLEHPWFQD